MLHAEPGTVSGACFDGAHSPWPRPFAPPTPQQIALPCSPASQLLWPRPTSHARASSATAPRLPDADRRTRERTLNRRPVTRYPSFRRDPFARDVLLDPGGTAMPRMTALHMLRSTISTVSAPASSSFRGSITHPTQPLCTLRVRRHRRLTQHSLPGGSLGLTWAGLSNRIQVHTNTSAATMIQINAGSFSYMAAGQYAAIGRCLWKWERPRQEVEPAPGPPLPNLHLWGVQ